MNEIKLAILRDMGLNNNGYASKVDTVFNVAGTVPAWTPGVVKPEFESLVEFGHLKFLGVAPKYIGGKAREFYCLPEDYANVKAMLEELTTSL